MVDTPQWGHYKWSRIWLSSYTSGFKQNVSSIQWFLLTKTTCINDTIVRRFLMLLSFSVSWNMLRSGSYVELPWLVKWSWRRRISCKCRNYVRLSAESTSHNCKTQPQRFFYHVMPIAKSVVFISELSLTIQMEVLWGFWHFSSTFKSIEVLAFSLFMRF